MNAPAKIQTSEEYRAAAHHWASMDGAARELEELKTSTVARMMKALNVGDKPPPLAAAERDVKASDEYRDYVMDMVRARTAANEARAEMDYLMMRHQEEMRRGS